MAEAATKIEPNAAAEIIAGLNKALGDLVVETMKAQNFHWNVTGMAFKSLHEFFEEIYTDHFAAQDELAERVKALGGHAEGSLSAHLKTATIKDHEGAATDREMIEALAADQEAISATLRALAEVADAHGDVVTNDLAVSRAAEHDKFAWMLRARLA